MRRAWARSPSAWRVSSAGLAVRLALLLTVAGWVGSAALARAEIIPLPDDDPFYAVPTNVASLADGKVIRSRETTSTLASVPLPARSWQVLYKTTDQLDRPTATVTTVLVPRLVPPPGGGVRPVVSYQIAEDGLGTRCAPSYGIRAGLAAPLSLIPLETLAYTQALAHGWTVVSPDYEGPESLYWGAAGTARAVLDGIRAARSFSPAGIDPQAPIGLWGYSAGANASVWAAQLQRSYAPELPIVGTAYGGVVAEVRPALKSIAGTLFGGTTALFLAGVDRSYPGAQLQRHLNAEGRKVIAESRDSCSPEVIARYPAADIDRYLDVPGGIDSPVFDETFGQMDPVTFPGTPTTPVYDYRGTADQVSTVASSRRLADRFCRAGVPTEKVEFGGIEHVGGFALGLPGVLQFLGDRFAGASPRSTCGVPPDPPRATSTAARSCPRGTRSTPRTTVTASATRGTRRRVVVRGRATGGCDPSRPATAERVRRVSVSVARLVGGRCRFLTPRGRFTAARSCGRTVALRARGAERWSYVGSFALPRGRYRVTASATDAGGRRQPGTGAVRTITVR